MSFDSEWEGIGPVTATSVSVVGPTTEIDIANPSGVATITFTDPRIGDPNWNGRGTISSQPGALGGMGIDIRGGSDVNTPSDQHSRILLADTDLMLQHSDASGTFTNSSIIDLFPDRIDVQKFLVVASETWHDVALLNGWVNRVGWDHFSYRLLPDGMVKLRGSVSGGTAVNGTQIGSVPAGYRPPTHDAVGPIASDVLPAAYAAANGNPRLQIQTGGNMFIYGTGPGPLFFENFLYASI